MPASKEPKAAQPACAGGVRKPARVLIVDDHPLIRKGLRALIDGQSDMTSCGEAASANEAQVQVDKTRPDIVVVDVSLPGNSGIDLIRDLKARHPELPLLVLSMHDEMLYAEQAMRAGAGGYVMKQEPPERLMEGLRTVLKGEMFVSPRLASTMLNAFVGGSSRANGRSGIELLSVRELQVFEGIGSGMSTQQLGPKYGISPKTIETYRVHIKRKLGLTTGNELVHAAVRWMESEAAGKTSTGKSAPGGKTSARKTSAKHQSKRKP
jgi:DNA-binding NarL/FixJ family response regulator